MYKVVLEQKVNKELSMENVDPYKIFLEDSPVFYPKFGNMYNFLAVTDVRKITSTNDWVVPTKTNWDTLVAAVGASNSDQVRETGTVYWSDAGGSTNSRKLNLRGSGIRYFSGSFGNLMSYTFLWTSTTYTGTTAYTFRTGWGTETLDVTTGPRTIGIGIRLIKTSTVLTDGEESTYVGNDGKTYRTICIGTQEWLADNLAETLFRNGDQIPTVTDATTWSNLTTAAMCYYNNNVSYSY